MTTSAAATIATLSSRRWVGRLPLREMVTRSYVLTLAFVAFRMLQDLPILTDLAMPERFTAIAWLGWTVPLIATELVIHGRRVLAPSAVAS